MTITVKAKQLGRKYDLIAKNQIEIADNYLQPTVKWLICAVVKQQVALFNQKPFEKNLLPFLDSASIADEATTGKVGFGSIYNEKKMDLQAAESTALQAFEDGLFAMFIDEHECVSLHETININSETVVTFIRLTFLAGSFW
jgi:hypothetical protein